MNARLTFEPPNFDKVAALCEELVAGARQDTGLIEYSYWVNEARDAVFIREEYVDDDALLRHIANIDHEVIGRLVEVAAMGGVEVVGSRTTKVEEALAGFGEVAFFEPLCSV